ncbi:MAG TPA: peptidoglycan editing factor PgeF [Alphaproteobacteria bacterium]|nr:peptidoglycan editing factor PgeF [Alphaproteobacteria bacterium]
MFVSKELLKCDHITHTFGGKNTSLPVGAVTLKQVHSNLVIEVDKPLEKDQILEADGLITATREFTIAIKTADCVPILLAHKSEKIIAALHAGWRSSYLGIVKNCLESFKNKGYLAKDFIVAVGPCIQQPSFEVSQDVFDLFKAPEFFTKKEKGKYLLNLSGYLKNQLHTLGVETVESLQNDTYVEEENFFSYRRSFHKNVPLEGHQWSFIKIL